MKSKRFLLVSISLIMVLLLASCNFVHQCNFGEEWKSDETNHWRECECGLKNEEGAHTFGEWKTNEDGDNVRECTVCGYEEVESAEEEHEHDYSETWSKDGEYHWHSCSGCNVPSEKSEHSWNEGEVTTPATETAEGVKLLTCTVCEATKEEIIPMLNHTHTFADQWTSDETYHWHAATCIHTSEVDGKAEHDWNDGEETEPPTCSKVGVMTYTCMTCNATKTEDIQKLDHTEEILAKVDSTCEKTGLTEGKKCSVCGEILLAQEETKALGHKYAVTYKWSDDNSTCTATKICENDASHTATETVTVSTVDINVTATQVTYTYNVVFADADFAAQTESVVADITLVDSIATINAPAIANRVPSHDYVKFDLQNAESGSFTIYYSELSEAWNGTDISESLYGSGTADNPYLIQSAADLAYFAKIVNEHNVDGTFTKDHDSREVYTVFTGVYFKLTKSIDLNGNYLRIGYSQSWNIYSRFGGIFDGNNCSIRGIKIEGTGAALFGMVSGTVKNLSTYGYVKGDKTLNGGIVGHLVGKVENCTSYVNVEGVNESGGIVGYMNNGTILNCTNYGKVACYGANAGTIFGKSEGTQTVEGCTSFTELNVFILTVKYETADGIELHEATVHKFVGETTYTVNALAIEGYIPNQDSVSGSISGFEATVTIVYAEEVDEFTVTVQHLNIDGTELKAATVHTFDINAKTYEIEFENYNGLVPNKSYVKGAIQGTETTVTIYYSEMVVWNGSDVSSGLSGSGSATDPYLIQSGADLKWLDNNMTATNNFSGVYFKLTKSIDLNGNSMKIGEYPGWSGRKTFCGIFDGNNCTIRNLNMTESGKGAGLFSVVKGTVKDLAVYGTVKGDAEMTGGIVGWLYKEKTEDNATLENCTSYVNVASTGATETGGVVGTCQNGTMLNCTSYGSVVGVDSVGGIAGKASGALTDCDNYGTVNGCSDVGEIKGSNHSAGTPTLTNCNNYGVVEIKHILTQHAAVAATCEVAGNVEYWSCSGCGKNYDADGNVLSSVAVDATGHNYNDGVTANGIITYTCQNSGCGHTYTEYAAYTVTVNHLFLNGDVAETSESSTFAYNSIPKIEAKTIEGYVASHDYVMIDRANNKIPNNATVNEDGSVTINIYYSEVSVWDGSSVSESLSGSGTEADPYLIQSAADLAYLAKVVNEHNVEGTYTKDHTSREVYTVFSGKYFKLTKSINLNDNYLQIGYSLAWNKYSRFGGTFDGNNCSIRGIKITADHTDRNDALFGMVYSGAVKNLSTYGEVYGGGVLNGGVVGYLVGGTVDNCASYVNIDGNNETGGIVGNLDSGTITGCTNYGKVTCTGASADEIVGKNASGTVSEDCISFTELNAE